MKKFSILALICVAGVASAQIINGGFETGDFTGWTEDPASSGSLYFIDTGDPHSGQFELAFGAVADIPDYVFQNVAVTNGNSYTLSAWFDNSDASGDDDVELWWEGTQLFQGSASVGYTQVSFNVTAHSNSAEVRVGGFDGPDFSFVDDVELTPSSVPEPATLAVFGLGIAGAALIRRRK